MEGLFQERYWCNFFKTFCFSKNIFTASVFNTALTNQNKIKK